ncbi:phosphotransferase [Kitasatospora sp. LaBMicrA B282]|uniref:phosphotransferase n=1 Tax=Kitasatospora sp. LaBMicrA B282 TaxID=3420949 RepID=UPI003D0B4156
MSLSVRQFVKHYATPQRCSAAHRHHAWLTRCAPALVQPDLVAVEPTTLSLRYVRGRHAEPADLPRLASMLGTAHAQAWARELQRAGLDRSHRSADGTVLPDYTSVRRQALERRLAEHYLPDRKALCRLLDILERTAEGPSAFYKDTNPRNVLIAASTIFTVDTDDLTLAPFGYDLAKLVHTLALSYHPLKPAAVDSAIQHYNAAAAETDGCLTVLTSSRFDEFLLLHRVLTAPYLHRDHYRRGAPQPLFRETR